MPLTDSAIKTAKPKEKPFKLSDGHGLYLEVTPTGSKLWRLKYRIAGKEKKLAIGAYPAVSLQQARQRRTDARELLAQGADPSAEKKRRQTSATGRWRDIRDAGAGVVRLQRATLGRKHRLQGEAVHGKRPDTRHRCAPG